MMNQLERIKEIRKDWGNKPCDHPNLEKEYFLGFDTGYYFCTQCGKEIPGFSKDKLIRNNKII